MAKRVLTAMMVCCFAATAVSADDEQMTDAERLAAGLKAVANLKPLRPGKPVESYFGVYNGPNELGYVTTTIKLGDDSTKPTMEYLSKTSVMTLGGVRVAMIVQGTFKPNFEPIDLVVKRRIMKPDEDDQWIVHHAVIGPKKVKVTTKTSSTEETTEDDRPEAPFIYGIETFVQRFDLFNYKEFALREFNVVNGAAGRLNFVLEAWDDGLPTLAVREPVEGEVVYQFWFTMQGELIRFGEPTHPVLYVKITEDKAKEIMKVFGDVQAE